ncbi:MAG: glycosyltransferase family 2 protein [Chitinophagaceae bacterium]|nr:glycosyltransferase family 2 protein [Chitinophagaceae bacterium]
MKISGFTFVRNAVKFDYPVTESIRSVLPVVDEFIVSVGNSDDSTLQLIESIGSPKIKIHHSVWDDSLKEGGRVLAVETDKALAHVSPDADWAFYVQADEVVHENDLEKIVSAAKRHLDDKEVEGLLFKYKHFYGTYDYVGDSRRWYSHEIRLLRNTGQVVSYQDAQGFRTRDNRKLKVKSIDAFIYHYGWVRHPHKQLEKLNSFYTLWNGAEYQAPEVKETDAFDFFKDADSIERFTGTHPAVMKQRIEEKNWQVNFDPRKKKFTFKDRILYGFEKLTGIRPFTHRNYRII